jgi:lipopolysaccharide export system permease protein
MFQILRLADLFITQHAPGILVAKMAGMMVVQALPVAMPMAFLMGVIMAFGRLSNDSEFIALKACGLSLPRITAPIFIGAFVVSLLSLAVNLDWAPWAERNTHATVIKVGETTAVSSIHEGTFTTGFFGILIYAEKVEKKTGELLKVFIYDEREAGHPMAVVAQKGQMVPVKSGRELGSAALLRLFDGSIHNYSSKEKSYQKTNFGEYKLYLKVDEGAANYVTKFKMLRWNELLRDTDATERSDGRNDRWKEMVAEKWRRIALALVPLCFTFLGIGIGSFHSRNVRSGAGLVTIVIILAYWGLLSYSIDLGRFSSVPVWLAMQIPNISVLLAAILPYRRAAF